jgi:hypothetical protein
MRKLGKSVGIPKNRTLAPKNRTLAPKNRTLDSKNHTLELTLNLKFLLNHKKLRGNAGKMWKYI